jgi:hypothetical protein
MTFKIEKNEDGLRTIYQLSGRIGAENLAQLKAEVNGEGGSALDLRHVTLVDLEGIRFLNACEASGIELIHCSPFIREWISRERER